jgi:hypothetical protein
MFTEHERWRASRIGANAHGVNGPVRGNAVRAALAVRERRRV